MNRKLLVSLLHKNIEELDMITEGFMEMNEYPIAIIKLARRKTEDIQSIIDQLTEITSVNNNPETKFQAVEDIKHSEPEFTIIVPSPEKPEIKPIITETKIQPTEETKNDEPEFTVVIPTAQNESEIETVELETLVQNAKDKIKISEDFGFKDEIEEDLSVVQTVDETIITVKTIEAKEFNEINGNHEIKLTSDETRKTTIAEKIGGTTISRNEKLSKTDNSLSASLANKKIEDIKQAISIGDRFRFQRELFNGNGEDMNKTLHYINQLASLEEVISFLTTKYNWDKDNETFEDFKQIVKRKFN